MKVLIVDNQDSFTYNIVDILRKLGTYDYIVSEAPSYAQVIESEKIIFSPGPGLPGVFSYMFRILKIFHKKKAILGICLGHQAIAQFFGANLYRLKFPIHGQKHRVVLLKDSKLFANCPRSFEVGLYHSWAVLKETIKPPIFFTSISDSGVIMSIEHTSLPIFGVQFHPESYISECGMQILENFLNI